MKIVAVPDLRQAPNLDQVEDAIANEVPYLTVFLGDYFDNLWGTPEDAARTAKWLIESLA